MRPPFRVLCILLSFAVVVPQIAAAQSVPAPVVIQNVTVNADSSVITIAGTGLGPDVIVTLDGQAVTLLPGATATRVEIQAPAPVLTTPGTYRLTVVDPVRHIGDAFVVATAPTNVSVGAATVTGTLAAGSGTTLSSGETRAAHQPEFAAVSRSANVPSPRTVIEDSGAPYRTAIGYQALFSNTTGSGNTASGYQALYANTTGYANTATGSGALESNTTGLGNTALGLQALGFNTTGIQNTASGLQAMLHNTTGERNVASGFAALRGNTIGSANTASGFYALEANTSGSYNAAAGTYALSTNTTGVENTATGYAALYSNTTGYFNTANGVAALYANTTGLYNTASGREALRFTTTGSFNVAMGADALHANVTGNDNTATGVSALASSTASFNTAHGTNALLNTTTGGANVGVGSKAGLNATTGSYNVFVGADVTGTAADTNTIRIGLPYDGAAGQNQTYIAGIYGTQLTGTAHAVFIDSNGRLGTVTPGVVSGGGTTGPSAAEQQIKRQAAINDELRAQIARLDATNAELRAELVRLEALVTRTAARNERK